VRRKGKLTVAMEELCTAGFELNEGQVDRTAVSTGGVDDIFLTGGGYHGGKAEQGGGDSDELHGFGFGFVDTAGLFLRGLR